MLWDAALDPEILRVMAVATVSTDTEAVPIAALRPWLTIVPAPSGGEHAVFSDGWHRIRIDLTDGSLARGPVILHYALHGVRYTQCKIPALRRLVHLFAHRCFPSGLFPIDPRINRLLMILRAGDVLRMGASQRELAQILFGVARVADEWSGRSDALRSQVRRLATEARRLAGGGYRALLRRE